MEGPDPEAEGPASDSKDAAGSSNDRKNELADDEDVDGFPEDDGSLDDGGGVGSVVFDDDSIGDRAAEKVVPEAPAAESVGADGAAEPRVAASHAERAREVRPVLDMLHSSRFGCFSLLPKQPGSSGTGRFGGFQGSCPFHKKNSKTGCKKFISIKGPLPEDKDRCGRSFTGAHKPALAGCNGSTSMWL